MAASAPIPPAPAPLGKVRAVFAGLACVLSVIAVGVELVTHICSQAFFDPLPDAASVAAYLFLALLLPVNEWVLSQRVWSDARAHAVLARRTALCMAGTGAALAIAATYTVIFAPILPISCMAVFAAGLGFCGLSPLFNLCMFTLQFRALAKAWSAVSLAPERGVYTAAAVCGLLAGVVLVGRPLVTGYFIQQALRGTGRSREASLGWLRLLGARETLLNLCYRNNTSLWVEAGRTLGTPSLSGPQSDPTFSSGISLQSQPSQGDVAEARKLYYLLTGHPFESAPNSGLLSQKLQSRWESDPVVEEQGGELVGRAAPGLSLSASRLDGVLDPRTETAYCEWTLQFQNEGRADQEARAEILLPEGGVVDKASLWINDMERPAVFGPRDAVRKAYRQVAIVRRHDPLLVTAVDASRVMVQCFPVPAGKTMKVRVGLTAPLLWKDASHPRLVFTPPAFQQVNFRLDREHPTEAWLEGHWPTEQGRLEGSGWTVADVPASRAHPGDAVHRARATFAAAQVLDPPALSLAGWHAPRAGDRPAPGLVRDDAPFRAPATAVDLLVLVDPTLDMGPAMTAAARSALAGALAGLPSGSRVRLADSRDAALTGGKRATPWLKPDSREDFERWLGGRQYAGGMEPVPPLHWAWSQLADGGRPAAILWLHGATPNHFGDVEGLRPNLERAADGPALVGVRLVPGPDALMRELGGLRRVYSLATHPGEDTFALAVRRAALAVEDRNGNGLLPLGGRIPAINGVYLDGSTPNNTHAGRLATASRVLDPWYAGAQSGKLAQAAQKLAIANHLVTPYSGAVVLETKQQYREAGLDDSHAADSIPSVPEPSVMALLALAAVAGSVLVARRRLLRDPLARKVAAP